MKKIIFLIIFLEVLNFQFDHVAKAGNYYADTVRIELKNGAMIELCGVDLLRHFPNKFQINKDLSEFLYYWDKLKIKDLSLNKKMLIRFDWFNIILSELITSDNYTLSRRDSIVLFPNKGHILELNTHISTKVRIYFSDFSQLKEIEGLNTELVFEELKKEVNTDKDLLHENNIAMLKWYRLNENNTLTAIYKTCSERVSTDQLQLVFGTNLQNLKGVWVGGFNARIALAFGRKMVLKNKYSFQYDWIYDFSSSEQGFQKHVNHFVGLGYEHNLSSDPKNSSWYGISASYLIKRNGNFFNKNTFNIGITHSINNHIEIQPMIYFNDFFKNAYPSLKIIVGF
jgi:putative sterol carrier protein